MDRPPEVPSAAVRAFGWGGAALFVLSLIFFLFSYDVRYARDLAGSASATAIVVNVILFSIFGLHHSIFARATIRTSVQRAFGVLERSFYVWVASALFLAVCALWRPVAGDAWKVYGGLAWLLRLLHVGGIVLSVASAAAIDIWDLAGIKQISSSGASRLPTLDSLDADRIEEFKTTGPYGWVRHPIYLGWVLLVFAVPHMTMTRLTFAIVSTAYLLVAIPFEERSLVESSAGAYDRYKQRVKSRLVPGIY